MVPAIQIGPCASQYKFSTQDSRQCSVQNTNQWDTSQVIPGQGLEKVCPSQQAENWGEDSTHWVKNPFLKIPSNTVLLSNTAVNALTNKVGIPTLNETVQKPFIFQMSD